VLKGVVLAAFVMAVSSRYFRSLFEPQILGVDVGQAITLFKKS